MATQAIKDILDFQEIDPTFSLLPRYGGVVNSKATLTRNGQDNVARTLDPSTGKITQVAEDTQRVYGGEQALLIESGKRVNQVPYSSTINVSNWGSDSGLNSEDGYFNKFIDDGRAFEFKGNGNYTSVYQNCGTFSGGQECAYCIVEPTSPLKPAALQVRDTTNKDNNILRINFETESVSIESNFFGSMTDLYLRKIADNGPAGGPIYFAGFRYSQSPGGNTRQVKLLPDIADHNDKQTFHHVQIEENANDSSPIVTDASTKTRAADQFEVDVSGFYNSREGTFIFEYAPSIYRVGGVVRTLALANTNGDDVRLLEYDALGDAKVYEEGIGTADDYPGNLTPYEFDTLAVSYTPTEYRLAQNGSTSKASLGSTVASNAMETLTLGASSNELALYRSIKYIPRALPLTESNRSAGDPPSLETLTV